MCHSSALSSLTPRNLTVLRSLLLQDAFVRDYPPEWVLLLGALQCEHSPFTIHYCIAVRQTHCYVITSIKHVLRIEAAVDTVSSDLAIRLGTLVSNYILMCVLLSRASNVLVH